MSDPRTLYTEKRAEILIRNLKSRHFDAYYCPTKADALQKALELIPEGATVGWGGAQSAQDIGLIKAVSEQVKQVKPLDRDKAKNAAERTQIMKQCLTADVFIAGANALSIDGQMVNIDGNGNRVAAITFGPDEVIIIAGMNKVVDTLEMAVQRARTIAAPMNKQRFSDNGTPCLVSGVCANCKSETSICNQILITRNCRPASRIKFVIVGEDLGF